MDGNGQDVTLRDSTLIDLVHTSLEAAGAGNWGVSLDEMWCHAVPSEYCWLEQGWKVHVAATRASMNAVLERSVEVLVRHRCAFKFAKSSEQVGLLNSANYPRGHAGKFLTAYPQDDEHFRRVAGELDRATAGLAGPSILSDRPYRPGSLVHYRYGAFVGGRVLGNDGDYRFTIRGPDGTLIEDRRDAWFNPPPGVSSPLEDDGAPAPSAPSPVLLGDRFVVREAIRHANRGGVYRATDRETQAEVVIKVARPHVEAFIEGWDACDVLRHEAEILDRLAPLGVAPNKIALFEQGGYLFLVEELIPGVSLHQWVLNRTEGRSGLPWPIAAGVIRRLAKLVAAVNAAGLALRDLTRSNVFVTVDDELRVIDLELAAPLGSETATAGTLGYSAPERFKGGPVTAAADAYSVGAIGFLLATGGDPAFAEDLPAVRSTVERLEGWLAVTSGHNEAARRLTPLILGLMDEAPERRWDMERAQAFLDAQERALATAPAGVASVAGQDPIGPLLGPDDQKRLVEDGLAHLLSSMTPEDQDRLWPSTPFGTTTDPCNVHHGAAGVLAVLTQAARTSGDERLRDALRTGCAWIERRLPAEPRLLPGLHFGRSGTAWALFDAAGVLGDDGIAERAVALAKRVPIDWPNPDVTHGVAGAGLAQLHFWRATGDAEFRERVERCADGLVTTAEHTPTGAMWRVPASFDSVFAGQTYYGFAHGTAGIGWFLLAAGLATGRQDCLTLARESGETLCAVARREGSGATWGEGPSDQRAGWVHWCHGSSGVGTFLVRLWRFTKDERFRELAEMAATAVRRDRWRASPAVCHGLAGNAEFLLDLAAALDDPRYRMWAEELAGVIFARCAYRDGRLVAPDETEIGVAADYSVGLAGVVAFLLRLMDGGPRMWMAESAACELAPC